MAEMEYQWGADVFCSDGEKPFGKLSRIVVDPESRKVSHVVVEQGLPLMKKAWVVPKREVVRTSDEGIWLRSSEAGFSEFPVYKQREIEEVAPGYHTSSATAGPTALGAQGTIPMVRRVVHDGVPSDQLTVLQQGVEVYDQQKQKAVGKLAGIVVHGEVGEINGLIVKSGLFGEQVTYPQAGIEYLDEDRVLVSGEPERLTREAEERVAAEPSASALPVHTRIELALQEDERTRDEVIEVVEQQGVVALLGEVESLAAKQAAEEIASDQPGVTLVDNNLRIRSH